MQELLKYYKQKIAITFSANFNEFTDNEGNLLKSKDYLKFIIEGKHFEDKGIKDGNLVFAEKCVNEDELPGIYVIQQDDGKFKCRRIISKSAKPECYFYIAYDENDKEFIDCVEKYQIVGKVKYAFDIPKIEYQFPKIGLKNKIKNLFNKFDKFIKNLAIWKKFKK